ncbi:MAG: hypothetical protein JSV36_07720 [Anaerolineae bacterium]|nr:MAG: hypothetical protein JSV36_07720 [Anaerolineae bacterium]
MDSFEERAQLERYKDIRREMERERLVRQALAGREKRGRFYGPALVWLGCRLVAWGRRLQESYGTAVEAPTLHLADHTRGAR